MGICDLAAFTGTVGALMGLARTPPDVAVSNLSEWARKIGFHRIPGWLRDRRADEITYRWAARAFVALILVGIVGVGIYLTSSRTALTNPSVVTPIPPTQTQQPTPTEPSGVYKYIVDGLTKAREDLLSIRKEDLSCNALSQWQERASTAARLAMLITSKFIIPSHNICQHAKTLLTLNC